MADYREVAECAAHFLAAYCDRRYGPGMYPEAQSVLADSARLLVDELERAGLMDEYRRPDGKGYWLGPDIRHSDGTA